MSALFVRLEVDWVDNPKLIAAGMDGRGCHAVACCLAKRLETDGWVHRDVLVDHGANRALVDRLIALEVFDVDGYLVRPEGWDSSRPRHRPAIPTWVRREVYERDNYECQQCGATEPLVLDHVIPYSKGGPDTVPNLQVLCAPCNWAKGARL